MPARIPDTTDIVDGAASVLFASLGEKIETSVRRIEDKIDAKVDKLEQKIEFLQDKANDQAQFLQDKSSQTAKEVEDRLDRRFIESENAATKTHDAFATRMDNIETWIDRLKGATAIISLVVVAAIPIIIHNYFKG